MAGAAVGGRVAETHPLGAAGVVGREVLLLGAHEQLRVTVVLGQAVAALGQEVAELALTESHHLQAADDRVGVAELELGPDIGEVLLRDVAALGQLHGHGHGTAGRYRVDGVQVAQVVGVGDRVQVADAAVRAEAE